MSLPAATNGDLAEGVSRDRGRLYDTMVSVARRGSMMLVASPPSKAHNTAVRITDDRKRIMAQKAVEYRVFWKATRRGLWPDELVTASLASGIDVQREET
ncbi:hypothetical protein [Bradyrhizobium sp. USDA 4473]